VPLLSEVEVTPAARYADLGGCDVVVIAAGVTLSPGQTRLDLLSANAATITGIIGELDRVCPGAVVILVTNPVDVLTRIAVEASARPAHLILGCGTVLDGARLQQRLGELLDVERECVHAYVVGEHGDSSFPVWSSAAVGAIGLEQFGLPGGRSWPQVKDELAAATRRRGMSIHERKGYTSYGVAAAVARIVGAITHDEKRIFMVSVLAAREYGIGPVVLGLPCVIGAAGIDRQLLLPMSAEEQQMLRRSAAVLDRAYRSLAAGGAATGPGEAR
jgi:L-lactate dehydrogenase